MPITTLTIPLRPETIPDKPSFTMVRTAAPFDTNNTRTCLFVKAKTSDGAAGVDVFDVTDPPIVVRNFRGTLKAPFQNDIYLYPLGAIDTGQYIDLPVIMMGHADKGIAAILREFGTPKILHINSLGSTVLHPGIGHYGVDSLPSLGFYVSDSTNVYFLRAGLGKLTEYARTTPPAKILNHPSDNLEQAAPSPATSRTAVFLQQQRSPNFLFDICNPQTNSNELITNPGYFTNSNVTAVTLYRGGPPDNDIRLALYTDTDNFVENIILYYLDSHVRTTGHLEYGSVTSVDPVSAGQYIYFVSRDRDSIQIFSVTRQQQRILIPGAIVGQPCLGANGELIVTYDGRSTLRPSGCLALATDGTIKWTYEVTGSWPVTAAVFSQGWVGFFGVTSDTKPFVNLLTNPG